MELQFLGTGIGVPTKHRNVTNITLKLLDKRNEVWLLGCGEGMQMRILRATIRSRKTGKIFVTHLHGDHIFGFPGLISSRSFQGGDTPLEIYRPKGVEEYIKVSLGIPQTRLSYPLKSAELSETDPVFTDQQFSVYAKRLDHETGSLDYRVTERDYRGELQVDRPKELDIPAGPLYGKLKQGETIQLEGGRTINGKDLVGPNKKGQIVTILGDMRRIRNSVVLMEDNDILVHKNIFNKDEAKMAHSHSHSTTHQAIEVIKEAQAKRLLLTHISARYLGKAALEPEKEAKEVFENTTIMRDFDNIEMPSREKDEA